MITVERVRKRFGAAVAIEDVSLTVPAAQCLLLLGPNGAGKTTLLRILGTLLRPTSGRLVLNGVDAVQNPEGARGMLAMVGHGSHVYEDLTARENLRFWTMMRGRDLGPARLDAALREVELDTVGQERARTFSAGMKRDRKSVV